jgi:hypothetical protein
MKSVKLLSFISLVLVIAMVSIVDATALPKQGDGKIKGAILDVNDARVANASITIEGNKIKRVVKSDDQGQFEISLPPGRYQVTVKANGFRRFVYSSLTTHANETEVINVHVVVGAVDSVLVPATR